MLPEGRKHCQGLPPDVLINLPDNVIDVILMCLPCKDGVRTSVLSKKWRYHWCRLAKFELDESLWRTQKDRLYPTVRLAKIVYQLLTHHEGPITKFKLRIAHADLKECPEIDNFIYFLSRKGIQHLVLHLPEDGSISSICLKNVPLMAKASLMHEGSSREAENFDYAKFFESCSSLEHLLLNFKYGKFFADETPTRLPFDLNRLKHLRLSNIVVKESYKLSCALCLIRSSPYLEYLEIEIYGYYDGAPESLELERFSDITFNHLREVTLIKFGRTTLEMQLIKLLLAKSPMLVKMLIYPVFNLETTSEILDELSKFGHASPKAVIVYYDKKEVIVNFS
ncbi:PREDICTED: F-box/LRR-repeat protein At4g14103-like isoform X2 [Nicotiana attenuata]|uniref:F-box/LRR-repeat protein At4g14103-like isoform X2 n=1 Tax=Nicotiana attenuata TaxID=49451 RepID=UPI0009056EDA|nr:PREDICTED: F-box/LRR-repeat protein At4g14103-like isoform X2 [Nicotiana attenuata]